MKNKRYRSLCAKRALCASAGLDKAKNAASKWNVDIPTGQLCNGVNQDNRQPAQQDRYQSRRYNNLSLGTSRLLDQPTNPVHDVLGQRWIVEIWFSLIELQFPINALSTLQNNSSGFHNAGAPHEIPGTVTRKNNKNSTNGMNFSYRIRNFVSSIFIHQLISISYSCTAGVTGNWGEQSTLPCLGTSNWICSASERLDFLVIAQHWFHHPLHPGIVFLAKLVIAILHRRAQRFANDQGKNGGLPNPHRTTQNNRHWRP